MLHTAQQNISFKTLDIIHVDARVITAQTGAVHVNKRLENWQIKNILFFKKHFIRALIRTGRTITVMNISGSRCVCANPFQPAQTYWVSEDIPPRPLPHQPTL